MTAAIWIACGIAFGVSYALMGAMILTAVLICLTAIDLDTQLLPDSLTLPLIWIGLLLNLSGTYTTLESAVLGAVAGYLSLWSVYWGFKLLTGKEGMGYGDFKLLAALEPGLESGAIPTLILASSWLAPSSVSCLSLPAIKAAIPLCRLGHFWQAQVYFTSFSQTCCWV